MIPSARPSALGSGARASELALGRRASAPGEAGSSLGARPGLHKAEDNGPPSVVPGAFASVVRRSVRARFVLGRLSLGWSQTRAAKYLRVDKRTIARWEAIECSVDIPADALMLIEAAARVAANE